MEPTGSTPYSQGLSNYPQSEPSEFNYAL